MGFSNTRHFMALLFACKWEQLCVCGGGELLIAPTLSTDVKETNSPLHIGAGTSVDRLFLSASLEELSRPQGDSSVRFLGKL